MDGICRRRIYTLYNSGHAKDVTENLAARFEVFRAAIGDADDSIEFYHFASGKRTRAYWFADQGGDSKRIVFNEGPPFECERNFYRNTFGKTSWPSHVNWESRSRTWRLR